MQAFYIFCQIPKVGFSWRVQDIWLRLTQPIINISKRNWTGEEEEEGMRKEQKKCTRTHMHTLTHMHIYTRTCRLRENKTEQDSNGAFSALSMEARWHCQCPGWAVATASLHIFLFIYLHRGRWKNRDIFYIHFPTLVHCILIWLLFPALHQICPWWDHQLTT